MEVGEPNHDLSERFRDIIASLGDQASSNEEDWVAPVSSEKIETVDLLQRSLLEHGASVMTKTPDQEYAELRAQLAEARAETKLSEVLKRVDVGFAEMRGTMTALDARLTNIERSTSGLKSTVIGTAVAVVAVVIGVLAYGQTWFGIGVSTRDTIRATVTELNSQIKSTANPQH